MEPLENCVWKWGGMAHTTRVLQWIAVNSSAGTAKEERQWGNPCVNRAECLWVSVMGKGKKTKFLVGICYRPPSQDEEMDKLL